VSFGGLLMSINGDVKSLKNLEIDSRIYLLMSRIWETGRNRWLRGQRERMSNYYNYNCCCYKYV